MEREVGEGIGMGNTCKPMAVSFQCMTKFTTNKKKEWEKKIVQVNLFTEQNVTDVENKFMVTSGERWKGIIWEIETDT